MKKSEQDEAGEYMRVAQALMGRGVPTDWHVYVRHVMPELVDATLIQPADGGRGKRPRICSRAKTGLLKLVSAHSTYITPRGVNWFTYEWGDEEDKDWMMKAGQVALKELENSNFHTELLATIIDRVATGTGLMLAEKGEDGGLVFTHVPAGTYALAENANHEVETVVRKFMFSPQQAVDKWGVDAMPEAMRQAYDSADTRYTANYEIWHLTMRRDVANEGNVGLNGAEEIDARKMSWAQVYLYPGENKVIAESGFEEFPYLATRHLKVGNSVYGESVLAPIVDTIENCIEMDEALKEQAKVCAYPRLLAMADMVEEINMDAGGVTVLREKNLGSGLPREWAAGSEFKTGRDLLELYYAEIDDALYVSVLQVVSQVQRQMTAMEVQSRESEKLMTFTQTFTQFTADLRPLMNRVFCLLMRQGKFGEVSGAPRKLLRVVRMSDDAKEPLRLQVLAPGVRYIGRLAKALERNKQSGIQNALNFAIGMAQATQDAAWLDWAKPHEIMQFVNGEENVPVECTRGLTECAKREEERQEAQAAQAKMQMAQEQAAVNRENAASAAAMNGAQGV